MFKRILIFFLITSILSNGAMQLVIYSGYKLNKEYITSVFCINKEHPELHCDGKCFLATKLKDLEKKNKTEQENLRRVIEAEPSFKFVVLNHIIPSFEVKTEIGYLQKPLPSLHLSIFQPPKLA
ncbi:hypothetical protein [Pedobacter nototheniae]|uniref:hypothetical protein n=1 Tax=Pedobacter nototheniae TaxID=2488994 RepID=UPI00292D771C|nr:hypothetical protein [Pedobacter nototheniae]